MIPFILKIFVQAFVWTYVCTQSHARRIWKETHSSAINGNHGEENGRGDFSFIINSSVSLNILQYARINIWLLKENTS